MAGAAEKKSISKAARPAGKPQATAIADNQDALDIGILKDVLGFRFRRIQNHLARSFAEHERHGNLKSGLYSVLALIDANPGASQARLAHEAGSDKTALVAMLDDLEDAGWAVRTKARSDRRKHSLFITDKGREALASLTIAAHEIEAPAREALTPEQFEQLLEMLDKIYTVCFREEAL